MHLISFSASQMIGYNSLHTRTLKPCSHFCKSNCIIKIPSIACIPAEQQNTHGSLTRNVLVSSIKTYENIKALKYKTFKTILQCSITLNYKKSILDFQTDKIIKLAQYVKCEHLCTSQSTCMPKYAQ
jgi:hypothetical protein